MCACANKLVPLFDPSAASGCECPAKKPCTCKDEAAWRDSKTQEGCRQWAGSDCSLPRSSVSCGPDECFCVSDGGLTSLNQLTGSESVTMFSWVGVLETDGCLKKKKCPKRGQGGGGAGSFLFSAVAAAGGSRCSSPCTCEDNETWRDSKYPQMGCSQWASLDCSLRVFRMMYTHVHH